MNTHTKKQLDTFLSQLVETNATLDFYCDFEKVKKNVAEIEMKLNQLNFLIGKSNLTDAVKSLWQHDKRVFDVLPILIAVRQKDNKKVVMADGKIVPINEYKKSVNGILEYLQETGLAQLFKDKTIKNLVDYVFGVEAGLDSHARKNRSGSVMEDLISRVFIKHGIKFKQEVYSDAIPKIHSSLKGDRKRYIYTITTNN